MSETLEELHTVAEVAPKVGMTKQALYAACRKGDFPCIRIGKRRIRVPSSALKKWLDEKTTGLQAQPGPQAASAAA
jgi:excisionase family DNA binding protein